MRGQVFIRQRSPRGAASADEWLPVTTSTRAAVGLELREQRELLVDALKR